jgi:hypothetical protein
MGARYSRATIQLIKFEPFPFIWNSEAEKQAYYETLRSRDIHPTRYADETCLWQLGLYDSVNHMLNLLD